MQAPNILLTISYYKINKLAQPTSAMSYNVFTIITQLNHANPSKLKLTNKFTESKCNLPVQFLSIPSTV